MKTEKKKDNKHHPKPLPHSKESLMVMINSLTDCVQRNIKALKQSSGRNIKARIALEHTVNRRAHSLQALEGHDPLMAKELRETIKKGGVCEV